MPKGGSKFSTSRPCRTAAYYASKDGSKSSSSKEYYISDHEYTRHADYCSYPSDPCNCYVNNPSERRTYHKSYCGYPSEPCCCDLDKAERGKCD